MTSWKSAPLTTFVARNLAFLPEHALPRRVAGYLWRARLRLGCGFYSSPAVKKTASTASLVVEQPLLAQHENWLQFNPPRQVQELQRIMIVGSIKDETMVSISEFLASCHTPVDLCSSLDAALNSVAQNSNIWRLLIVDVDLDQDIESLIDELSQFRVAAPNKPVVLMGSVFGQNDLSSERATIADLTLRHPIRLSWLQNYLKIAEQNNAEWRARQPLDL